jgi:subtilisin-like proprotein convertase family protein
VTTAAWVTRALLLALVLAAVPGSAHAATKTYSTGPVALAIHESAAASLRVRDRGPVSRVTAAVRIDFPRTGDLKLVLRSPKGTAVILAANRGGAGKNFGTGRGCGGQLTVFDSEYGSPIREGVAPFGDSPYRPEQSLARFNGEGAAGRWTLVIENAAQRRLGSLRCWQLTVSRNVLERRVVQRKQVSAELTYRETNFMFFGVRLRIARSGRTGLDASLGEVNCRMCPNRGLLFTGDRNPMTIRDLDFDREPEVLLDLYTGGAHCCSYTLIFRYRPRFGDYRRLVGWWGNVGRRIVDLDHDGRPELVSADDRFSYTFAAYAASVQPLQIWHYDRARLVDVTRAFPRMIEREAGSLWRAYLTVRKSAYPEVRGILAAYLADLYLLGREDEGWRRLEEAFRRGDLGRGPSKDGWPAGQAYLHKLRAFLRETGYAA